jgi:ribulose bisphosphate carboxylase small subunit
MKKILLKEQYILELGFEPTVGYIIERAIKEGNWPKKMFNSILLSEATGVSRKNLSTCLSDLSANGTIQYIGSSHHGLKMYKLKDIVVR